VIREFGNKTEAQALSYFDGLKEQGRFLKDVY
jgi:hypothetical protein